MVVVVNLVLWYIVDHLNVILIIIIIVPPHPYCEVARGRLARWTCSSLIV